jgi:hypothetical protein
VIFIPNSFQWKDGKLRDDLAIFNISQIVILILESAILLFIIYFINKWYLANIMKVSNNRAIALWTGGILLLIELAFIIVLAYWSITARS